jgi:MraZ protein
MLLTGTFNRLLDEKQRIAIPKRLRDAMKCIPRGVLYITPGTDRSLGIYSEDAFSQIADRMALVSPARQDVRAFLRLFYAQAQRVDLDRQGRLRIPLELVQLARLDKEVVLLGVQNHLELWAADQWQQYFTDKQIHYDEIAEKAWEIRDREQGTADRG